MRTEPPVISPSLTEYSCTNLPNRDELSRTVCALPSVSRGLACSSFPLQCATRGPADGGGHPVQTQRRSAELCARLWPPCSGSPRPAAPPLPPGRSHEELEQASRRLGLAGARLARDEEDSLVVAVLEQSAVRRVASANRCGGSSSAPPRPR